MEKCGTGVSGKMVRLQYWVQSATSLRRKGENNDLNVIVEEFDRKSSSRVGGLPAFAALEVREEGR